MTDESIKIQTTVNDAKMGGQKGHSQTFKYLPIKTKVTLFFGALVIFWAILMVAYLQYFVRPSFKKEIDSNLHTIKEKNVGIYAVAVDGMKMHALDWSSDNQIKNLTQTIVDPVVSPARQSAAADAFGAYLRDKKMRYDPLMLIVDLLDENGIVVASSRASRIGVDEREEELENQAHYFSKTITANFGETFIRSVVFEEDESPETMLHLTTRMFQAELDMNGDPIPLPAVLLFHFISLPKLAQFLENEHHGLTMITNESDEYSSIKEFKTLQTYLVNNDGIIVTPARGAQSVETKQYIATKPVEECLKNGKEFTGEYLDYRGVSVIGVSACFPVDKLVILNEIESDEAYAVLNTLVRDTIAGLGIISIMVIAVVFLATRRLLRNLERVTFVAKWFSLGVFGERAPVVSQDEIGQLATAFNVMLDKIYTSKKDLTENLKNT